MIKLIVALAAALFVAAPSLAQEQATDWSEERRVTDDGGYAMGDPEAPVHLVEYVSLTCPHCAAFKAASYEPLVRDYVATGQVHYEVRNFVRDPADLTGAMMARCTGSEGFFDLTRELLAEQVNWMNTMRAKGDVELNTIFQTQGLEGLAVVSGMAEIGERHGLDAATRLQCLEGRPHIDRLFNMSRVAQSEHGVRGTPSFLINDGLVTAHDWASLQPLLDAALAE